MRFLVSLLVLLSAIGANAEHPTAYAPVPQEAAPVQVTAATYLKDGSPGSFVLENYSERSVVAVRLGWTLVDCTDNIEEIRRCLERPVQKVGVSDYVSVLISPKQATKFLDVQLLTNESLDTKLEGIPLTHEINVYVGVVGVRFADGSEWEYDLVNERQWKWNKAILNGYMPTEGAANYASVEGERGIVGLQVTCIGAA